MDLLIPLAPCAPLNRSVAGRRATTPLEEQVNGVTSILCPDHTRAIRRRYGNRNITDEKTVDMSLVSYGTVHSCFDRHTKFVKTRKKLCKEMDGRCQETSRDIP